MVQRTVTGALAHVAAISAQAAQANESQRYMQNRIDAAHDATCNQAKPVTALGDLDEKLHLALNRATYLRDQLRDFADRIGLPLDPMPAPPPGVGASGSLGSVVHELHDKAASLHSVLDGIESAMHSLRGHA